MVSFLKTDAPATAGMRQEVVFFFLSWLRGFGHSAVETTAGVRTGPEGSPHRKREGRLSQREGRKEGQDGVGVRPIKTRVT